MKTLTQNDVYQIILNTPVFSEEVKSNLLENFGQINAEQAMGILKIIDKYEKKMIQVGNSNIIKKGAESSNIMSKIRLESETFHENETKDADEELDYLLNLC